MNDEAERAATSESSVLSDELPLRTRVVADRGATTASTRRIEALKPASGWRAQ
jgi:hypothetical protein